MDQGKFESLLRYYLSCIDAEEAAQLKLRKDQEFKSHIYLSENSGEQLFSNSLGKLDFTLTDKRQKEFIERRSVNTETLIDLYYGFPIYIDDKDMLCPLFFIEVEANFHGVDKVSLVPKIGGINVNRMHFANNQTAEEIQAICQEIEGDFGSFEARMKAVSQYIPSLMEKSDQWIMKPILFRTNLKGAKSDLRYDLTYILKDASALEHDTALKVFVQGNKSIVHNQGYSKSELILEPSTLNDQQEEAVKKGLHEPLFVVTGPPGTGKTQVVTALISSAVFQNKTVLFSSNNNLPVDGVYERLGQGMTQVGNWILRLGNQSKREECKQTISALLEKIINSHILQASTQNELKAIRDIDHSINEVRHKLKSAAELNDKITDLIKKESGLVASLPVDVISAFDNIDPPALDEDLLRKIRGHSAQGVWLWLRLKILGQGKFKKRYNQLLSSLIAHDGSLDIYKDYSISLESLDESLQRARELSDILNAHQSWAWCVKQRRSLEDKLAKIPSSLDIKTLKQEKSDLSKVLLDKRWLDKICNLAADALMDFNGYFKDIEDYSPGRHKRLESSFNALKRFFPIWISTNQSAGKIMPPQPGLFDLVVIDEAGQCDIPSVIPLLYRAKSAVIIGDPHQFHHITSLKGDTEYAIAIRSKITDIYEEWSFTKRSAFDRGFAAASSSAFLKQHYRCHPDIIEFSNENFYEERLVAQAPLTQFQNYLPIKENGLIWHNTPGKALKAQKGAWNPAEIDRVVSVLELWGKQGLFSQAGITYGVIAPFNKQVQEIRKALSQTNWFSDVEDRFTIGTVHSFQGSECDVLIYSPVIAEGLDKYLINFAASQSDLINVTVTRAKSLLYIVGDLKACQSVSSDTPLYKLASYAEKIRQRQRYPLNAAETAMASILDSLNLSYVPQYPLGKYRLDFLVNSPSGERYDLEVDGDVHLTPESVHHDEVRDAYVTSKGLKVLRFSARDILAREDLVKARLERI
jgi:superfamily I DNA and/or RNA helicase/very-short-patch-repair endonuclease